MSQTDHNFMYGAGWKMEISSLKLYKSNNFALDAVTRQHPGLYLSCCMTPGNL